MCVALGQSTVACSIHVALILYVYWTCSVKITSGVAGRDDGSVHIARILYVGISNAWRHISVKTASGVAVRGDCGVAGEGRLDGVPKFSFLGWVHRAINEYQLRLDVQRFLWTVNYIKYITLHGSFKLHLGSWSTETICQNLCIDSVHLNWIDKHGR